MLTTVQVRKSNGQQLELPLWSADSGYSVREITGLDPVKATIVTSAFASMDGEQYQSSRREKRNILMLLGMELGYSDKSVRELRNYLYNFFMPKEQVVISFIDDIGVTFNIEGRVESFDAPLFIKEPRATISILCFDPDFKASVANLRSFNTVEGAIEASLKYPGTVPTGVNFQMDVNRPIPGFIFYQRSPDNIIRAIDITYDFFSGDVVKINTVPGSKSVTLTRGGLETSILYAMSTASTWTSLHTGENTVRVVVEGAAIPYTLAWNDRYGGL